MKRIRISEGDKTLLRKRLNIITRAFLILLIAVCVSFSFQMKQAKAASSSYSWNPLISISGLSANGFIGFDQTNKVYAYYVGTTDPIVYFYDANGNFIKSWNSGVLPSAGGVAVSLFAFSKGKFYAHVNWNNTWFLVDYATLSYTPINWFQTSNNVNFYIDGSGQVWIQSLQSGSSGFDYIYESYGTSGSLVYSQPSLSWGMNNYIIPFSDGTGIWIYNGSNSSAIGYEEFYNTATGKFTPNTTTWSPQAGQPAIGFPNVSQFYAASGNRISAINSNGWMWTINSDGTGSETYVGTQYINGSNLYPTADGNYIARGTNGNIWTVNSSNPTIQTDTGQPWNDPNGYGLNSYPPSYEGVFAPDIYFIPNYSGYSPVAYVLGSAQVGTPSIVSTSSTQSSITGTVTTTTGTLGLNFNYKLLDSSNNVVQLLNNQNQNFTFTGLPSGTTYHLQVQISNVFGNTSSWYGVGTLATIPATPSAPSVSISGNGWQASNGMDKLSVSWSGISGATGYNLILMNGGSVLQTYDMGNVTSGTITVPDQTHSAGYTDSNGNYTVAIESYNVSNGARQVSPAGNTISVAPVIQSDSSPPLWGSTPIILNNGNQYTGTGTIPIQINASDPLSGVSQILVSNDNVSWTTFNVGTSTQGLTSLSNYTVTSNWQLPPGTGQKTIYVKLIDLVGNISSIQTSYEGLQVNTVPPTVSLAINGGQAQTSSTNVTLTITAADPAYTASQLTMSFSNDGQTWSTPVAYASTYSWTLPSSTSGSYSVFVRVTDPAANTGIAYAQIYLVNPSTAPSVGGSTGTTGGTIGVTYSGSSGSSSATTVSYNGYSPVYVVQSNEVTLDFSSSGASYVSVSTDNISFSKLYSTSSPFTIDLPAGDGFKTVYAALANTNNISALGPTGKIYFLVDTTAPTLTLSNPKGATVTSGTSFTLQLAASDNTTPASQLQVQVNGGSWFTMPNNNQVTVTGFTKGSGLQTATVSVKDLAGNITTKTFNFWSI